MIKTSVVNIESLEKIPSNEKRAPAGFRYGFIENLFDEEFYKKLVATFPDIKKFKLISKMSGGGHKRFYLGPEYTINRHGVCGCDLNDVSTEWKKVFRICASPKFINFLSEKTGVKCNSLCNFGFTYGNEGCHQECHIDGAVRADDPNETKATLALLLYFHPDRSTIGGTCIYDIDRKTIVAQAGHLHNSSFYFEQHAEAWHGFPEMPSGKERFLVSLTYSNEARPIKIDNSLFHRLTCKRNIKRVIKKFIRQT